MTASNPITAGGATVAFSWIQGEVTGTDQRSDSYTSGQGQVIVIDGSGGGSSSVSTEVVIRRDIWIRTAEGAEHHLRIEQDIPVRVGQEVAFISCTGEVRRPDRPLHAAGGLVAVFVLSTNRSYAVLPLDAVASALAQPPAIPAKRIGNAAMWICSIILVPVFAIGLVLLFVLSCLALLRRRRRAELAKSILGEIKAGYQAVLDDLHSQHRAWVAGAASPGRIQAGASA